MENDPSEQGKGKSHPPLDQLPGDQLPHQLPGDQSPGFGAAAFFCLCPQCGAKTLFDGIAQFAPRCRACGLKIDRFNVGDGPAAFLTLIIGAVIIGLALWLEVSLHPPFWVHAIVWIPLTALAVVGGLRMAKAALLYGEYTHNAGEAGRRQ